MCRWWWANGSRKTQLVNHRSHDSLVFNPYSRGLTILYFTPLFDLSGRVALVIGAAQVMGTANRFAFADTTDYL